MLKKKYLYPLLSLIIFLCFSPGLALRAQQNHLIYAPAGFPKEVLNDGLQLLSQATAIQWKAAAQEKEVKTGYILHIQDHPEFKTKESYQLKSDGKSILIISSSSIEGLVFAFYKQLRSLGFKFYLPDELYTILPSRINPFGAKKDIIDKPFLQIRNFAGTGGFGTVNPDPDKSVEKSWNLWKIRNGFGTAYHLSGHMGEEFIIVNKKKLQENPKWLASSFTSNALDDQTIKLNYQNKDAMNFFIDWTLKKFTRSDYRTLPAGHTDLVSIEPSDGGGYINDLPGNQNKNLPSVSDQVYGAANMAAQKLDQLFPNHPNIGVNLYAYSTHAEPPSFQLHPRVFVQLVPYQFQNIAFGPAFIKMWSGKAKRFGIYDYFKYADAQADVPGGITIDEAMKRLVQSVKAGSEGTTYETSYSKFSTGIPLWLLGRYMTEGDANWQKNLSELVNDLYSQNKQPVADLFNLFYNESGFNVNLMGNAVSLLDKATNSKNDLQVQKRISELKSYLQFTNLVYQSRDMTRGSLKERLLPLLEYTWKIYETSIVHGYRDMQLISYSFLNSDHAAKDYKEYEKLFYDWFLETERSKTVWSKIPQGLTTQEIDRDFQLLKKKYNAVTVNQTYKLSDIKQELAKYKPIQTFVIGGDYISRGYFGLATEKSTEVKIKYSLTNASVPAKVTISVIDPDFSPMVFTLNKTSGELKFSIPAGENTVFINASTGTSYRMEVKLDKGIIFFDGAPRGPMAFYKNFSDPANQYTYDPRFYPSYIFFPKNAQKVDFKVQLNALQISSPSKSKTNSTLLQTEHGGFEIRQLSIHQPESGKFWKAVITGNYNYSFLNIPDRYFLLEEK